MNNGVFLDTDSLGRDDVDLSGIQATLPAWTFHGVSAPDEVAGRIQDAQVVIASKVRLGEQEFRTATGLRLICIAATGTNNVDIEAAARRGITVCNVTGYATPSVTQHVFTLMFALATHLSDYHAAVREGRWAKSAQFCLLDYPITELSGKRLGIVGYGELGKALARQAECFGMEVLIAARPGGEARPGRIPLDELLPVVDVLSLHCPLTETTRGLIGAREIGLMQGHALLINTARGGIVDEAALAGALKRGSIGGAGIDVLSAEPPHSGNPLLEGDFSNLIVTPHIAWASRESRMRLVAGLRDNIEAFLAGKPRNIVAPVG